MSKILSDTKNPQRRAQYFKKYDQKGEISPNLVTLPARYLHLNTALHLIE